MRQDKSNSSQIIVIYIFALILAASTFPIWQNTVNQWPYFGYTTKTEGDQIIISNIVQNMPAEKAGIRVGDIVVEFAGIDMTPTVVKRSNWFWDGIKSGLLAPGRPVTMVIERQGEHITTVITPIKLSDVFSSKIDEVILFVLLSLIGIVLLIKTSGSRTAVVLAFCLLALATFLGDAYVPLSMLSWLDLVRQVVFQAGLFFSPLLLHFALIYPQKKGLVMKSKWVIPLIYTPWILFYAYGLIEQLYIYFFAGGQARFWIAQIEPYSEQRIILRFIVVLVFIGLVLYTFFKSRSTANKRPATWMLIAVLCGLIPVLIIEFLQVFTTVLANGSSAKTIAVIIDKLLILGVACCFAWSVWLREGNRADSSAKPGA